MEKSTSFGEEQETSEFKGVCWLSDGMFQEVCFFICLLVNTFVNECLKLLSNFIHIDLGFLACCWVRWKALFFMLLLKISRVDVNVLKTQRSNVNR